MTTEIKTWEILNGELVPLESTLADEGRTENLDLEAWLESEPSIIRPGLAIVGRQTMTQSGPLDLLAIDRIGNLVVIELKRDRLPREALAQAIDYASDVASWSLEKVGEICATYSGKSLEDVLSESFPDIDLESLSINDSQRILLVGFSVDSSLERMIEWLSESYGVAINAVILKYVRSRNGSEILTRTAIISEDLEEARSKKKKFKIAMSDEPGEYDPEELRKKLRSYLSKEMVTAKRIRDVVLPACLNQESVTREELKEEFVRSETLSNPDKVGYVLSLVSSQLGLEKNDFLRQVLGYGYPNYSWEKDNYFVRTEYRALVREVLSEVSGNSTEGTS